MQWLMEQQRTSIPEFLFPGMGTASTTPHSISQVTFESQLKGGVATLSRTCDQSNKEDKMAFEIGGECWDDFDALSPGKSSDE